MKPVVVYKSGATEQGQKAASSHTGALAGSYQMTVDLLRQAGVSVVQYSDEILPVAEGLGRLQKAPGKRVAVISDGGARCYCLRHLPLTRWTWRAPRMRTPRCWQAALSW